MENLNTIQINDEKVCSELILQDSDLSLINTENPPQVQEVKNSEIYTELENGNEVITIVGEENAEEIFLCEKNENLQNSNENSNEYIQVCDLNNALQEVSNSHDKEMIANVNIEESLKKKIKENKEEKNETRETITVNIAEAQVCTSANSNILEEEHLKNFKNVILEDWGLGTAQVTENCEVNNSMQMIEIQEEICKETKTIENTESQNILVENFKNGTVKSSNTNNDKGIPFKKCLTKDEILTQNISPDSKISDKKIESIKIPKSITKNEIVKILDETADRVVRPIATGKDLFFSIELTKRLNQKLSQGKHFKNQESENKSNENHSCNNNNSLDERQKIVDILEADEVKDWKSVSAKPISVTKENGNDMEISKAIKIMEEENSCENSTTKLQKRTPGKKFRALDKELERTIALQQLREEFPSTRKRSRASKKMQHIPFLASTVLEKALTSPEVTTALKPGPPKRRPCYLPENMSFGKSNDNINIDNKKEEKSKKTKGKVNKETIEDSNAKVNDDLKPIIENSRKPLSNPFVKTYSVKRKSMDTESELKSTIAAVRKALSESNEGEVNLKPKKQKTVLKPKHLKKNKPLLKEKKMKTVSATDKKRNLELEKLLGDEGAVRMLYDTQHKDPGAVAVKKPKFKTATGLKKDLVLKTKLVKNAVMRLSGIGTEGVSLRGKRRLAKTKPEIFKVEEPLFSSTPNIVLYKPKKKQRAEASRILYRHSSSESFESSEGYRRASFEVEGLNGLSNTELFINNGKQEQSTSVEPEEKEITKFKKSENLARQKIKKSQKDKGVVSNKLKVPTKKKRAEKSGLDSVPEGGTKLNWSNIPVRKSSRTRTISKKYSVWSSTSMDSLSVESLGLKKLKKASMELGKKLNVKEVIVLQYDNFVQIILAPASKLLKNSLSSGVLLELIQVFHRLAEEDSCRVVLLSSQGNTFCQGVDISQIISFNDNERKNEVSQLVKAIRDFIMCLAEFKKPIIVGVQAAAVGLGVTLLPYCDLVISSEKAIFYTPYLKIGQAPEGAPTHTFPHLHRHLVSELLYKNHKMTAADALKYGLITEVIPDTKFEEDLIMIARNVAARPAQGTLSLRLLLKCVEVKEVEEILVAEGKLLLEHWSSPDCINRMVSFLNSGELQFEKT